MRKVASLFVGIAVFLFLSVSTTTSIWAQNTINFLTQDPNDNSYLIYTESDWNNLADFVKDGNTCQGLSFKLMNDISVSTIMGYQTGTTAETRQRFAGTFDGNNKTLNVTLNSNNIGYNHNYCSPFAFVDNFTIRNLHVTGTIDSDGQFASGMCGSATGLCTIENCQVSVSITASLTSGNGNHGAFIGVAENGSSFTNCWFDGKFLGTNYKGSGGFVGINKVSAVLNNCLFNPSEIASSVNASTAATFIHHLVNLNPFTMNNVYYLTPFGEQQGAIVYENEPVDVSHEEVVCADGETYYLITGSLPWEQLQDDLNDATQNVIVLNQDVVAGSADVALVVPNGRTVTIDLNGFTIDRNLGNSGAVQNGYVIKVEENATLTITDSSVAGSGTITGGYNTGNGGGIFNYGVLNLNNVLVTANKSEAAGGGIYNGVTGTLNISNSKIKANTSNIKGGGLYLQHSCVITNSEISNNVVYVNTNGYGGGIYVDAGLLTIEDSNIEKNNSKNQGAGIYVNTGTVEATDCIINQNTAWAYATGGGVFINQGSFTLNGGEIKNNICSKTSNTTTKKGIGVYVSTNATFSISGEVTIDHNYYSENNSVISNVYLQTGKVINLSDALDSNSLIGVTLEQNGPFTSGLPTYGDLSSFFSDEGLNKGLDINNEGIIGNEITIHFEANNANAQGTMNDFTYIYCAGRQLPASTYTSSDGRVFSGWTTASDGTGDFYEDEADLSSFTANTTLYARWNTLMTIDNDATNNTTTIASGLNNGEYKVTLTNRTLFKDGAWNTLCLPFNVTLAGSILEGATAKTMDDAVMTGDHVDITFTSPVTVLQAGIPYIIKWESGSGADIVNPVFSNVTITQPQAQFIESTDQSTKFIGYYDAFGIDASNDDIYYMTSDNLLKRTAKARTLKSCRSYFQFVTGGGTSAKALSFNIAFGDDVATGIVNINADETLDGVQDLQIYDISGHSVARPSKGIYIVNGKKILVK